MSKPQQSPDSNPDQITHGNADAKTTFHFKREDGGLWVHCGAEDLEPVWGETRFEAIAKYNDQARKYCQNIQSETPK